MKDCAKIQIGLPGGVYSGEGLLPVICQKEKKRIIRSMHFQIAV